MHLQVKYANSVSFPHCLLCSLLRHWQSLPFFVLKENCPPQSISQSQLRQDGVQLPIQILWVRACPLLPNSF